MSNPADNATRTQRFNDAVRTFTPPSPTRHAKLMPLKEGIVELRQKGASLRLIRELLATVDVAVGTDTIARVDIPLSRRRMVHAASIVLQARSRCRPRARQFNRRRTTRRPSEHARADHASPIRATSDQPTIHEQTNQPRH